MAVTRRSLAFALSGATALWGVACSFDLDSLHADGDGKTSSSDGGALASSGAAPTLTGSTTVSGSSVSGSSGASPSTSSGPVAVGGMGPTSEESSSGSILPSASSSGGAGGAPPVLLQPCGIPADNFDTFPTAWKTSGTKQAKSNNDPNDMVARATVPDFNIDAHAALAGSEYHECYATIELIGLSQGTAYLDLWQDLLHNTQLKVSGNTLQYPSGSRDLSGPPHALAIVFHAESVYYLYMENGASVWEKPVDIEGRKDWMGDGDDDAIEFGISAVQGSSATFDNYNVHAVTVADLAL